MPRSDTSHRWNTPTAERVRNLRRALLVMSTTSTFTHVSLDGFFAGPKGEIDWFHSIPHDAEYDAYTHQQASAGRSTLLFGHTTYDMMKSFWPTPEADKTDPQMAKVMRNSPKVVVSKK
jgi:dihydrofolate reductase